MFERDIKKDAVLSTINNSEIIQEYLEDLPYPSYLILQNTKGHPIHVVLAFDESKKICYIVTVYEPDIAIWNDDFRSSRKK